MSVTYFKRYRMHFDLRDPIPDVTPVDEDYDFVPWNEKLINCHAFAKFNSFRNELDANVFPCLGEKEGCEGLMREIASRKGFVREATWLIIYSNSPAERTEFCGTVQGINDNGLIGSIQNLGVTPGHRGRGLAKGLLVRALAGFRCIGMDSVSLEVTAQNTDAIRLYEKFGFRTVRTVYKSIEIVGI